MEKPDFMPAGDSALVIRWHLPASPGLNRRITGLKDRLERALAGGVTDMVPAYSTLVVYYDPASVAYSRLVEQISGLLEENPQEEKAARSCKTVTIPVFYGGSFGPDLEHVARVKGLSPGEVVDIHCCQVYYVYMVGFLPGFPYLGFVDDRVAVDRRSQPRELVPAGSVGIAGRQTGIYSLDSPGGWQIIGRTPVRLFKPEKNQFLLRVGDRVVFRPAGDGVKFSDIDPEAWGDLCGSG